MSFTGKTVWITGASSGIGAALAAEFAAAGANLALSARREEALRETAARCGAPAERVLVLPLDLTDQTCLPARVEAVRERFGRIDVLVNNGGVSQRALAEETELEVTRRIFEVNFFGAVALTRAALPGLLAAGSGHVVVVTSVLGKFGAGNRSSYAASKHALHGYFDSLRCEVAGRGVAVTLLCPGWVRTAIGDSAFEGGGGRHGKMDKGQAGGMTPEACAKKMLRLIAARKEEALIAGWEETGAVLGKRWCPGLLSRILQCRKLD